MAVKFTNPVLIAPGCRFGRGHRRWRQSFADRCATLCRFEESRDCKSLKRKKTIWRLTCFQYRCSCKQRKAPFAQDLLSDRFVFRSGRRVRSGSCCRNQPVHIRIASGTGSADLGAILDRIDAAKRRQCMGGQRHDGNQLRPDANDRNLQLLLRQSHNTPRGWS